jgi:excisionase family DNA binding protein
MYKLNLMENNNQLPKLLTIREAAEILHVNPETLGRWDRTGKLKAIRVGRRQGGGDRRYRKEDLEKIINK